jgi:hypothetical protein
MAAAAAAAPLALELEAAERAGLTGSTLRC